MIEQIIGPSSFIAGFIVASISFLISTRYKKLALSFIFLGAAFLSYAFAELYWFILDMYGAEPYGSAVDIMYLSYYVFAILHVIFTLKGLKAKLEIEHGIIMFLIVLVLMFTYSAIAGLAHVDPDTFLYGAIFSGLASSLVAVSVVTVIRIYHTMLRKSWLIIGMAILIASITDVWYYTQENLTGYEYGEFPLMDILWFVTDVMIVLGIIVHRKKI